MVDYTLETHWLLSLALFAIISTATPGPNNIMLLASGLNFGARRSLPHALGIIIGVPIMVLAVGLGLGQVFVNYPAIHQIIKALGIAYLLYLAWRIATTDSKVSDKPSHSRPLTFIQAALFQWVNPKAWVMAIGAISAFTTIGAYTTDKIIIIALSFLGAATISTNLWIYGGVFLKPIVNSAHRRRWFNGVMGMLLFVSILPMLGTAVPN